MNKGSEIIKACLWVPKLVYETLESLLRDPEFAFFAALCLIVYSYQKFF